MRIRLVWFINKENVKCYKNILYISTIQKPQCHDEEMAFGGISINENYIYWDASIWDRIFGSSLKRWGNILSPMWQARAMALLGGYEYQSNDSF